MVMHYLSHQFSGDEAKNREEAERIQQELQEKFPNVLYVNPILNFKALEGMEYSTIMGYCLELLSRCDGMTVAGRYLESKRCMLEIAYAQDIDIPVVFYDAKQHEYVKGLGVI